MTPAAAWVVAGLLLCGAELLHPGVFLLWIGFAAVATGGVAAILPLDLTGQVAAFVLLLSASLWVSARRSRRRRHGPDVNAPDGALLGQSCQAMAFAGGEGRVRFRDGTWPARMADASSPAPGTALRIVGREGTVLVVVEA